MKLCLDKEMKKALLYFFILISMVAGEKGAFTEIVFYRIDVKYNTVVCDSG